MSKRNKNRQGYKKTKAGWIPEEWNANTLGSCFDLSSGVTKPGNTVPVKSDRSPFPVYGGNGILGYSSESFFTGETLVIGRVGEKCGCVHRVTGRYWITDNALYTSKWHRETDCQFFEYLLDYLKLNRLRNKGGQPLVSQTAIKTKQAAVPPLPEQKKIAEILSTWDEAIEQTRKLIDAKKHCKKALMQQLLTGKKRLPGFKEEWKAYRLSNLLSQVSRPVEFDDNAVYDLISVRRRSDGIFRRGEMPGHSIKTKQMYKARSGDFLISKMQIVHGASALVPQEFDGMHISGSYIALQGANPKNLDGNFLNWFSKTPYFYHLTYFASYGVHIEKMTFNLRLFLKSKITIPGTVDEQRRIANVLSTADDEIKTLEKKLAAFKQQKRGLMQKLLTGKLRVKT